MTKKKTTMTTTKKTKKKYCSLTSYTTAAFCVQSVPLSKTKPHSKQNYNHAEFRFSPFPSLPLLLLLLLSGEPAEAQSRECRGDSRNLSVAVLVWSRDSKEREMLMRRAADYAVNTVNREKVIPGFTLTYSLHETRCNEGAAMIRMDQARRQGVVGFIGPICENTCEPAGRLTHEWGLPMITYSCLSTALCQKTHYRTTARTVSSYLEFGRFLAAVLLHFKLLEVRVLICRHPLYDWVQLADEILRNRNGSPRSTAFVRAENGSAMLLQLPTIFEKACAVILCMVDKDAEIFLHGAKMAGYFNNGNVFISINLANTIRSDMLVSNFTGLLDVGMDINWNSARLQDFLLNIDPCLDHTVVEGDQRPLLNYTSNFQTACIYISQSLVPVQKLLTELCTKSSCTSVWSGALDDNSIRFLCKNASQFSSDIVCKHRVPEYFEAVTEAALMVDAFWLLARGLEAVLPSTTPTSTSAPSTQPCPINLRDMNMTLFIESITNSYASFPGVTGDFVLSEDGTRYTELVLRNLQTSGFVSVARSSFDAATMQAVYFTLSNEIVWPYGGTKTPICDKDNFFLYASKIFWAGVITLLIFLLCLFFFVRKNWNYRERNKRTAWNIPFSKLYSAPAFAGKIGNIMGGAQRKKEKSRGWNLQFSAGKRETTLDTELSRESLHNVVTGQIFAKVAVLDQQVVAVKPVNKKTIVLTPALMAEVSQMVRLKHNNVNRLIGACIEPSNVCLVWGYCHKGSLRDVLDNVNIKLDWMFKLAFVTDIAKGMNYLHSSPVQVHGCLKSTNVLVDTNWGCKVTDMSLPHFRAGERKEDLPSYEYFRSLLWTAPELLRNREIKDMVGGTQKGDVYSFAIIVHEVYYRSQPFGLNDTDLNDPKEVLQKVLLGESPPFRPSVNHHTEPEEQHRLAKEVLQDLMIMCWDEYPLLRLSFSTLSQNLKKIQEAFGTTENLVDQMLTMVRKYTDNLEQLVNDRTRQLEEERKKTDELLGKMLPQTVAEELKMGRPVIPESYTSATLYFSDIMGFSEIALISSPMQVVNLLNDLYICFDNVIETYDVYKVETIADNYVVSSGLPIRNGDRHSAEIATLALDLLTNVLSFTIRHLPDQQLMLRIGIHTGSVVAGVVGRKMPRYCLFGDTVNYTSRLESNGLPLHVHVSPECKECLDKLGGFRLKERGFVEMKGKGKILTYFLVGKDGMVCRVPNLRPNVKEMIGIDLDTTSTTLSLPSPDIANETEKKGSALAFDFLSHLKN